MKFEYQVTGNESGSSRFPNYDNLPLGFEGFWYPALFSHQISERPTVVSLFGSRIAFLRDGGQVYAFEDRCPHRGIPLSLGKKEFAGTWTCRYHGWTFDLATGTLVAALTDGPDSPICGRASATIYRVEERAGIVWLFRGEGAPPDLESQVPAELLRADAIIKGRVDEREGDWRHAAENGIDEGHVKYLHRDALFVLINKSPAWIISDLVTGEDGWITRKGKSLAFFSEYPGLGRWPKRRFWHFRKALATVAIRLPGVLRVHYGKWYHFEWYMPAELGRYRYFQVALKHAKGLNGLLFRLRYWLFARWALHYWFTNQDERMVRLMKTPPEQLYRPDNSIVAWRRLCEQHLAVRSPDTPHISHHEDQRRSANSGQSSADAENR